MLDRLRFLLLQVRNPDDPMRGAEVASFSRALKTRPDRISVCDILATAPTAAQLDAHDMILLGGSGHYSAAGEGAWLERALDTLREVCRDGKPTFASCWGFQAMARAMGGRVVKDLSHAEVGTIPLELTAAGRADPVFAPLGKQFHGQAGHEDCVVERPPGTTLLATSARVENQAYRFDGKPIYCTQFHPELSRDDLLARIDVYPEYIERIAGLPPSRFGELCRETPDTELLLPRFIQHVFDAG